VRVNVVIPAPVGYSHLSASYSRPWGYTRGEWALLITRFTVGHCYSRS